MSHGILIQNSVAASNIDALNRSVKASQDMDNGSVFLLNSLSTVAGEGEVWVASTPVAITNLWMAYEPEVVVTVSGSKQYKGINPDIRDFYNASGDVFTAFKPQVGDIITLSTDALAGTKGVNTYVTAVNGTEKLTWGVAAVSGLSLKLIRTTYISIADGTIGTQRVTAYGFVVEAIA